MRFIFAWLQLLMLGGVPKPGTLAVAVDVEEAVDSEEIVENGMTHRELVEQMKLEVSRLEPIKHQLSSRVTLWLLTDAAASQPAKLMFSRLSAEELAKWFPDGQAGISYGCIVAEVGDKKLMFDTSVGHNAPSAFKKPWHRTRPLVTMEHLLNVVGIDRGDIDYVIHSHIHTDHTGWNIYPGEPSEYFYNALHIMQWTEARYWNSTFGGRFRVNFTETFGAIERDGRLVVVDGEAIVLPGVEVAWWPGHTPGHQVVKVYDGGNTAYYVGDSLHHKVQLRRPDFSPWFDYAPWVSSTMRIKLFEQMAEEGAILMSPHLGFPAYGRVVKNPSGGFALEMLPPEPSEAFVWAKDTPTLGAWEDEATHLEMQEKPNYTWADAPMD